MRSTSLTAYQRAMARLPRRQAEIVSYLIDHETDGVTADEFKRHVGARSPNQYAPCFTALARAQVIVDSGQQRLTELRVPAIVWRLRDAEPPSEPHDWKGCERTLSGWHVVDKVTGACVHCGAHR